MDDSPIVYAPQQPARYDAEFQLWVPTADLSPASKWGRLVIMLPPRFGELGGAPMVVALKERMSQFRDRDFILGVGDPSLILAVGGIAALKTGGKLKMLKWDRKTRDYIVVEMDLS